MMHRHGLRYAQEATSRATTSGVAGIEGGVPRRYASSVVRQRKPPSSAPSGVVKEAAHLAKRLVGTAHNDRKKGWKSPSYGIDGRVPHLAASVRKTNERAKPTSQDSIIFSAPEPSDADAEDEAAELGLKSNLLRGSFVEVRRNDICMHAVVLYTTKSFDSRSFPCSLTTTGEIWQHQEGDVMFSFPRFIDQGLAERCGFREDAENEHQIAARVKVLQRLRDFEGSLERRMNSMSSSLFSIYDKVAPRDPSAWARITEPEVVKLLEDSPDSHSTLIQLAVHKHMLKNSKFFIPDATDFLSTQSFRVRPRSHVADITDVDQMVQHRDPALKEFIVKARKKVEASRRIAQESRMEPPSIVTDDVADFSPVDETIIRFLEYTLRKWRSVQQDPFITSQSYILKTLKLYEGEINSDMTTKFLFELGRLPPWEDLISRRIFVDNLKEPPEVEDPSASSSSLVRRDALTLLGPDDLYAYDVAESIRHDFGKLPVYVIDDVGAEELDDGISIEAVSSHPNKTWVHVHIADPTSVIPPTHTWAANAYRQLSTFYWVDRTEPMLPHEEALRKLSLGEHADGRPQPTLTFSLKVDEAGEIQDYAVRPGLVNNVIKLKYDQVDAALGITAPAVLRPFGGAASTDLGDASAMNNFVRDDLAALRQVALRLMQARARNGAIAFFRSHASMSMHPKPPPTKNDDSISIFRGFPQLTYNVEDSASGQSGSRGAVAEMMIGASRVASLFFRDRGISTLRRASSPLLSLLQYPDAQADLLAARNQYGVVPFTTAVRHCVSPSPGEHTLLPKAHQMMGIPEGEGYVRVTSPLRRFSDMVAHWQIKHALLHPTQRPLFSDEWQLRLAQWMETTMGPASRASVSQNHYFAIYFLKRWRALPPDAPEKRGRPDPLDNLTAVPMKLLHIDPTRSWGQLGVHVPGLGVKAQIVDLPQDQDLFDIGEEIPVVVDSTTLGVDPVLRLRWKGSR